MSNSSKEKKLDDVRSEPCPKCRNVMYQFAGLMTKCNRCLHEWYMDTSSRPKVPDETLSSKPVSEMSAMELMEVHSKAWLAI